LQYALIVCGVADDHDVGMVVHAPSFCAVFRSMATRSRKVKGLWQGLTGIIRPCILALFSN
jgi:hypothetical protein